MSVIQEGATMNDVLRYSAFEAFCRQRAKMEGENEIFWLAEAEILAKLATNAQRWQLLFHPISGKEKPLRRGAE
jgi:hypothetical protein